ncbi:MAG: glutamate-1-semialdehyde 2,1-aminomutase [candidate division WOR-3 bacterium]
MDFEIAKNYLIGGVNSPIRSFKEVGGKPIFIKKSEGSKIYDYDNKEYIDYVCGYGTLILGHRHPEVISAIREILNYGTHFYAISEYEIELARIIKSAIPQMELMRFTNSGTEATMSAIRIARGYTKRDKIVKFRGNYHGHSDSLIIDISEGIPKSLKSDTIIIDYNDVETLKKVFEIYGEEIACVIVEPIAGNMGLVLPRIEFLKALRELTLRYNSVLIFDEIITGFRLTFGSVGKIYNIYPDIITLGKIVGGGMPIGVYGGKREIMEVVSPLGSVYQAGTFSGNLISMVSGITTLRILKELNPYEEIEKITKSLVNSIEDIFKRKGIYAKINHIGSMFSIFFTNEDVYNHKTAESSDKQLYKKLFWKLIDKGIYPPPSNFEVWFLSAAHNLDDIEKTKEAINEIANEL